MFSRFEKRSFELERQDTGDFTAAEHRRWQTEMWFIHRMFGEVRALRRSIGRELRKAAQNRVSILDVGAGTGDMLRVLQKRNRSAFCVGAELDMISAAFIAGNRIAAVNCNALRLPFADNSFDLVYCSLMFHHLKDENAVELLREMRRVAKQKLFVIDLRRSAAAYYLYKLFGSVLLQPLTREDGALSVLRSFRQNELRELAVKAGLIEIEVTKSAAFRFILSAK
ncbi:MAG: methyltransferase domain-containing protein [Pyrinomonadaceae bacterium]